MPFQAATLPRLWLGRRVARREWLDIAVAAAAPSLARRTAAWLGLILAIVVMVSQAIGRSISSMLRSRSPSRVINAWQLALGLGFLLPFAAALDGGAGLRPTPQMIGCLAWSIVMVSVAANALFFTMQKRNPFRASTWLLLSLVFSYLQAALALGAPIGWTDLFGLALVVAGLIISGATQGQTSEKTEAWKNET